MDMKELKKDVINVNFTSLSVNLLVVEPIFGSSVNKTFPQKLKGYSVTHMFLHNFSKAFLKPNGHKEIVPVS